MNTCRTGFADWSKFRPYRYAHRGLHDLAAGIPENTMPAFARAADHGFGVELDVHLTTDGRLVVIHDSHLGRLCGIDRKAHELHSEDYRSLGILGTEYHAPMLEEVLPIFEGVAPVILEIKADSGNAVAVTEAACRVMDQFHVTYCMESFDPRVLIWLRKHRPDICRGQLSCDYGKEASVTLHPLLRKPLANLRGNFLTRPDFIAYKFADRAHPAPRRCIRQGAQEVSWTITTQKDLEIAEQDGCIVIFEGFFPK